MFLALAITRLASVREGCAVTAPPKEFNHFLRKATVFVIEHGDGGTVGVNLMKPTMLTIGEAAGVQGAIGENTLYEGGEAGGRGVLMIHAVQDLEGAKQIGDSGIFVGGLKAAVERVAIGRNHPSDFKFFFNYVKWPKGQLDQDVQSGRWTPFDLPHDLILHQDDDGRPTDLWNKIHRPQ
ncbi:hypothetical protein CTAYLR_004919 [Chrysophaeum taylorii]|uniref:Uncharacterized protein n=1 Tax=Chrysophaeum taylorii TaxID=2483200 RepID=A0AAD7UQ58_9STRA|nr:hypothetical protein CTAYLR_004919 [Chrysophaeum taylorii]